MRFRAGVLLCVFAVLFAVGCRKPLAPNIDRNQAPETWITAAPQDTLTPRDASGNPISTNPVSPSSIAFRFRIYWAGSDRDGAVVGYYVAVTETVSTPGLGEPSLPGPKPSDYQYTTRSDSTIVFTVFRDRPDRRHGFYVYAVDDKGKVDATPAKFIFNAVDQFPPVPIIDVSEGEADVFDINDNVAGVPLSTHHRTYTIRDTARIGAIARDTIPSSSRLRFRWHAEERVLDNPARSYQYKLTEATFNTVPATIDTANYAAGTFGVGNRVFTLLAIDQAGGARTSPTTTRFFHVNFTPDTWFAGPNPTPTTNPTYYSVDRKGRYRSMPSWVGLPGTAFPGSYFNADSAVVLPKDRLRRNTFFEFYEDRVYVRQEGDTVNMNSFVVFTGGGFDSDSPYNVRVNGFGIDTTLGAVFHKRPMNGSPSGFRLYVPVYLFPSGAQSGYPLSAVFPLDEALLVPERHIHGFLPMQQSGTAYATLRAVDGDGEEDARIPPNVKAFMDSSDNIMHPDRVPLKSRVIKFFVNRAPYFLYDLNGGTRPVPTSSLTRTIVFSAMTQATDDDPYDGTSRTPGGAAGSAPTLRWTIQVRGQNAAGRDTTYMPPTGYFRTTTPPSNITVPDYIVGTQVRVLVELSDFPTDTYVDGQGRSRLYTFDVTVPAPTAARSAATNASSSRPGEPSGAIGSRRQ